MFFIRWKVTTDMKGRKKWRIVAALAAAVAATLGGALHPEAGVVIAAALEAVGEALGEQPLPELAKPGS